MMNKFLLAGLIPGVLAKPVHIASSSTAKVGFSTAVPEKGHSHIGIIPDENKRNDASYPVVPLSAISVPLATPSVLPSSVATVLSSAVPSLGIAGIAEAPHQPSISVISASAVPVSIIQTFPVAVQYAVKTPAVQPVVVPTSAINLPASILETVPVDVQYAVKTPLVQPSLPVASPIVVASIPAQPYSIKTPPVQPVLPVATVASILSLDTPVAQAAYSVKTPVAVPVIPSVTSAVSAIPIIQVPVSKYPVAQVDSYAAALPSSNSLIQAPLSIITPAVAPALPVATYPAVQPVVQPVDQGYGVKSAVASSPYAVEAPAISVVSAGSYPSQAATYPSQAAAYPYQAVSNPSEEASYPDQAWSPSRKELCLKSCKAECENVQPLDEVGRCRSDCILTCHLDAHPLPDTDAIEDNRYAKSPTATPDRGVSDTVIGSGAITWEACMESCGGRYQHADIASDISTGSGYCAEACAGYTKSGAGVVVKRDVEERKNKAIPPPPTIVSSGGYDFEACLKSCRAKWQNAGIVHSSTGKGSCEEACASGDGEGSSIFAKREVEERKNKAIPPPPTIVGAGGYDFEACLKSCNARWQNAGIVHSSTGKGSCTEACASGSGYGAGVQVKREVKARKNKAVPPPATIVGSGGVEYQSCLQKCDWRQQTAHIANDVSQGRLSCKHACARYAASGAGVIVKKEADEE
ncbi:hypothetical protein F5Y03DRAFT_391733 [Xylaria venustula]|nr:hypothetical protein F5Y03DRAFT_391733 [Xylaria venustula]